MENFFFKQVKFCIGLFLRQFCIQSPRVYKQFWPASCDQVKSKVVLKRPAPGPSPAVPVPVRTFKAGRRVTPPANKRCREKGQVDD